MKNSTKRSKATARPARYLSPETRAKLSAAVKGRWARAKEREREERDREERDREERDCEERESLNISEARARYEREAREETFQSLRHGVQALFTTLDVFSNYDSLKREVDPVSLNELAQLDLGKAWHAFARAAISVKLKCALDPTKRYVAFADDATYVLQPESKGDQWRFHKTFFDGTTEECKHVMDVELVDWFEWLRVPYDLDWQMTPVDAAVEAEARKGEQR